MAKKSAAKKPFAAAVSVLTVILAVIYIIFAEDIASIAEKFVPTLGFSDLADVYRRQPADGTIEVHLIDVGQADSILIRSRDGNMLIDAGTSDSEAALKAHLDACEIKRLDYFICTHPHDDHIGGADMICKSFDVGTVIMADAAADSFALADLSRETEERNIPVRAPSIGESYELGDIFFTVMGPVGDQDNYNDTSLVVKLVYGGTSFLFAGDSETASEEALTSYYRNGELDCDFLKVGHHGANTSSSEEFLKSVTPEIAAISCEKFNDYGHPRDEVLQRLYDSGCQTVLRTDVLGTVVVRSDGSEITVLTDTVRK